MKEITEEEARDTGGGEEKDAIKKEALVQALGHLKRPEVDLFLPAGSFDAHEMAGHKAFRILTVGCDQQA